MPLPNDEQLVTKANEVLGLFKGAFGKHPGFRPAHAKGQLLSGKFTPTPSAKKLSKAAHFQGGDVPVIVRFSNSTGIPDIPDTSNDSKPHGFALRFELGEKDGKRQHTDIIGHSTPHFPVRTGADFAELLKAIGSSGPDVPSPKPIEKFLGSHPAAHRFVTAPKPFPKSLATEAYYALNAFYFIGPDGNKTAVRYRIEPTLSKKTLEEEAVKSKGPNFLFDEIAERIQTEKISFKLIAQIGKDGDSTDDVTEEWPEDRELVDLGHIELDKLVEDNAEKQRHAIFDPIPRVDGIEPSADPILEFRAALYLISGRQRRENKA